MLNFASAKFKKTPHYDEQIHFIVFTRPFICCVSCETNSAQTASSLDVKAYRAQLTGEKSFQLVDVRTAEEFESGHLERAININYNGNDFEQQINALDKNKPTYIYCLSGGRSSAAMDVMTKKGLNK